MKTIEDMKNIHLLPTTKEQHSIIRKHTGLLLIQTTDKVYSGTKLNLYITSDEKIKEGDWFLEKAGRQYPIQWNGKDKLNYHCKKIILTTDQSLDGVQSINNEFLEWFVKNPSCEYVEFEMQCLDPNCDGVNKKGVCISGNKPKLDENGCLILKKVMS
jgi:hypothetical protein